MPSTNRGIDNEIFMITFRKEGLDSVLNLKGVVRCTCYSSVIRLCHVCNIKKEDHEVWYIYYNTHLCPKCVSEFVVLEKLAE